MAKSLTESTVDDATGRAMKGAAKDNHGKDTATGTTPDTTKVDPIIGKGPGDPGH